MSTNAPRSIIVDNVDPSIQYIGPWFLDQGSETNVGNFGPPYQNTLHGVQANASFSFAFNGSQVTVIGTNNIRNDSGVLDPTWQCFVDDISIGASTPFIFPENNWVFCNQNSLVDGPHVLTVNATVLKNQTFWFDNIQYVPSASVPLDQAAIVVSHLDSQLQYGAGWGELGSIANMTLQNGSTFAFDFIGVSLSWYGFIPQELPISPSSGTYSIDGKTPINFKLNGLPTNTTATTYNQKFFETDQLSATSHTLEVVYQGSNSTPLTLTDLIIQNGTLSSTSTSASSLATSTSTGNSVSATSTAKSSTPVGPIVGAVIGGIALILFALLGAFLFRRRQKRAAQENASMSTPKPFEYIPPHPSSVAPNPSSGSISYSQIPQTDPAVRYGVKGHGPMPSATITDTFQSVEPPSTSSTYSTGSHTALLQQRRPLTLANPSSSSPPISASSPSGPSAALPLPSKVEREVGALAALRPQRRGAPSVPASVQSNDSWFSNPGVVLHADSGIRMPPSMSVTDVPPVYTPD